MPTTNYVVLVNCQADASLSKIVPKVEWFTLHCDFSCECLNNMATTVESMPSGKASQVEKYATVVSF